jgi:small GTP-binding protein
MNKSSASDKARKSRPKDYDVFIKVVVIGNASVGKSSIMIRFADNSFNEFYVNTIGVDFRFKTIEARSRKVKLQIWDTAGQEKFRAISNTYYRGSDAILMVYDITDASSREDLDSYWASQIAEHCPEVPYILLVGNKSDLESKRAVPKLVNGSTQTIRVGDATRNVYSAEVSAKENAGIHNIFEELALRIVNAKEARRNSKSVLMKIKEQPLTEIKEIDEEEGDGSKSSDKGKNKDQAVVASSPLRLSEHEMLYGDMAHASNQKKQPNSAHNDSFGSYKGENQAENQGFGLRIVKPNKDQPQNKQKQSDCTQCS